MKENEEELRRVGMDQELKATNLINLINYQEGSVVSRTLIEKQTGTVTLFAFDQGQGLSEHTTPFDAMACVLDGKVEVTVSDNSIILENGEIVIMPANKPHTLKAIEKFKMMLIMIKS